MIRLACSFVASIGRHQLEDYVRELEVDVLAFDESGQEVLVGRIAATQVLWADAENDRESLFDICDSDSQGLYEVYRTLTDEQGKIRSDLNADEVVDHIIFVHRIVLHPDLVFCRKAILESVVTLFGCESLAVMWKEYGQFLGIRIGGPGLLQNRRRGIDLPPFGIQDPVFQSPSTRPGRSFRSYAGTCGLGRRALGRGAGATVFHRVRSMTGLRASLHLMPPPRGPWDDCCSTH